jgi:D-serine deaminase-like pyridoxal phosphate-dependent protein
VHISELETPAIVVDLDAMERNLQQMSDYAREHKLNLRPHTKTHKTPEIARQQVALGSKGITVAKTGEAEVMAAAGLDDILVHYPVYGESKFERLAALAGRCKLSIALDGYETAEGLSRAAAKAGSTIHVLVEIDSGMRRCGTASPDDAAALAQRVDKLPNLQLAGLSTYPGHIWNKPNEQAGPLEALSNLLQESVERFRKHGLRCDTVSAGSTPAGRNSHLVQALTEMRPGTYVYNDRNTMGIGACSLDECALRVLVTVVSTAVPGRAILDAGSKTFSSDRWISGPSGHGLIVEHPDAEFAAMSEEHGHVDVASANWTPRIGERLTVVPNHVCSCVNLHNEIHFHRGGQVEFAIAVAGRGKVR